MHPKHMYDYTVTVGVLSLLIYNLAVAQICSIFNLTIHWYCHVWP